MKVFKILFSAFVLMSSTYVSAEDYIVGSCHLLLSGNDVKSSLFTNEQDTKIASLETSEVSYRNFIISKGQTKRFQQKVKQIVPYARDPRKYKHYQAVVFKDDTISLDLIQDEGVARAELPVNGEINIQISYHGKQPFRRFSYGSPLSMNSYELVVRIKGSDGVVLDKGPSIISFSGDERVRFSKSLEVPYQYRLLPGDGILGFLSEEVNQETLRKAPLEDMTADVDVECTFDLGGNLIEDDSARNISKEEGFQGFSEDMIIDGNTSSATNE
ncbi:MAG: hypothetical protein QF441_06345 [Bacteriovoracaceae bacterium]|nr:hypothetical protein [Halobacteriovoraceae bacterium]MDP7320209.1 hypothetical protein [Bacteriovoracaceae bacterium]